MRIWRNFFSFIVCVILAFTISADAIIIGFEAESGTLGDKLDPAQANVNALGEAYLTTELNNNANVTHPLTDDQTVSYSLTVPAGTYDVYIRGRIGPGSGGDDSFYYANSFGDTDPTVAGGWVLVNSNAEFGFALPASFGWSSTLATTVTSPGGIVQWEIGAREDGFDIDAFALVTSGQGVTDTELDNAVLAAQVILSSLNVSSNAPPGSLIGNLSIENTSGTFAYSLDTSGGDYDYFDIAAGTTNLRTAAWIDADSYNISIIGTEQGGDGEVVTNDFTITVDPVDRPTFLISADVQSGAADGALIGTARTMESGATFSLGNGREDLFYLDGEDLKVTNSADWGSVGTTNYIVLRAIDGNGTNELLIAAGVVSRATSATIFKFR